MGQLLYFYTACLRAVKSFILKAKILIVEDIFIEAQSLNVILTAADYITCTIARSVPQALTILEKEKPDIVLLDICLHGAETGIDLGHILHERDIPFIYLSANSGRKSLEQAKVTKPYGFMAKPFRARDVLNMLDVALYLHRNRPEEKQESRGRKAVMNNLPPELTHLTSKSNAFVTAMERAMNVSSCDTSVLILGESGTGKGVMAEAIHQLSARKHKPFIAVNCGAIPANLIESELFGHEKGAFTSAIASKCGKFEQANGGTLFLDEIGELPPELQVKFLRVLQDREVEPIGGHTRKVDIRIIAATNKDLEEEVASGRFRIDLFYRLHVFPVTMPPLRERQEDIPLLASYFLQKYSSMKSPTPLELSAKAMAQLTSYLWPGNIRELENTIQRNIVMAKGQVIETLEMPAFKKLHVTDSARVNGRFKTITENERDHIIEVLQSCNGKIAGKNGAADILNINANTLNSRMKKLGIDRLLTSAEKDT
ncbi:hypothetical protein GCM10011379_35590 [Filimonas zeae]|uniref:Sigma-54-dependent Fis family transcriptional regulator n=1 Tax=Filimonas zeae TaxID=1737353 RepID=A0A917MXC7_9BACT|nr:hypothetical protein GCM10011379_35590 [Filimonas zeae]